MQGRLVHSLEQNKRLLGRYPNFAEGRLQLANLLETMGDMKGAAAAYDTLVRGAGDASLRTLAGQRLQALRKRMR